MKNSQQCLSGKVALVTGATAGIGKAIALLLAQKGADVIVNGRNMERAQQVVSKIEALGRQAMKIQADVSRGKEVEQMVETVISKFKKIDILVNNAGIFEIVPITEMTEEQWDKIMNVNLKGTFNCSKAVIRYMIAQKSGKIINIASDAGKTGGAIPVAHYAASKAGVICFTKSLARELAPYGINVNAVSPGLIETKIAKQVLTKRKVSIPLGRLGKPEEVAYAVLFLVSDRADYITGEILDVNAGMVMD